jgi:aryl-alcohol dehydrogenase-like predicted oxidoreductase
MDNRKLGGLISSAVGLGTLALAGAYGAVAEDEAVAAVRGALDLGVTLLDTADFYGGGEVERRVGRAIAGRRGEAVVATRGGARFTEGSGKRPDRIDGSPQYLREACEASLRRLGVDCIDLYYLARVDPQVPVEESVGALGELVAEGKIRHIGLSEVPVQVLRRAHATAPVSALESEYSLWERGVEDEVLPAARELGIGLVAFSPLGRGFLTGGLTSPEQLGEGDIRRNHARFDQDNFTANRQLVVGVEQMAAELDVPAAQLALAWLLSRGDDVVPIPSTRSLTHLRTNADAATITLTPAQSARLADSLPWRSIHGDRLPQKR